MIKILDLIESFIGTLENNVWQTGFCHKTGPDLVHDAQLRYSEILLSYNNERLVKI